MIKVILFACFCALVSGQTFTRTITTQNQPQVIQLQPQSVRTGSQVITLQRNPQTVSTIRTVGGGSSGQTVSLQGLNLQGGGAQTLTLQDLQRLGLQGGGGQTLSLQDIQGLNLQGGGGQTLTLQDLQGLNLQGGGGQIQTINEASLRGLNLQGLNLQGGGGNVRIIQLPANGLQTANIQTTGQTVGVQTSGLQTAGIQTTNVNQGARIGIIRGSSGGSRQVITTTQEAAAPVPLAPPPPPAARVELRSNDVGDEPEPAPEPYSFQYTADTDDGASSERQESQDANGRVTGFYTINYADGTKRRVDYVADESGYRATVSTSEAGTETSNPADAVIESSQPSGAELSRQYTAELEQNGGIRQTQQVTNNRLTVQTVSAQAQPAPQPIRIVTTNTQRQNVQPIRLTTTTQSTSGRSNIEIIRPESIQQDIGLTRTVTLQQQQPQQQFVVVRVPAGQVPAGAVPVRDFVSNRQAAASNEQPSFFSDDFGARRFASASARSGVKI